MAEREGAEGISLREKAEGGEGALGADAAVVEVEGLGRKMEG